MLPTNLPTGKAASRHGAAGMKNSELRLAYKLATGSRKMSVHHYCESSTTDVSSRHLRQFTTMLAKLG
jgi:hypothetical protein